MAVMMMEEDETWFEYYLVCNKLSRDDERIEMTWRIISKDLLLWNTKKGDESKVI